MKRMPFVSGTMPETITTAWLFGRCGPDPWYDVVERSVHRRLGDGSSQEPCGSIREYVGPRNADQNHGIRSLVRHCASRHAAVTPHILEQISVETLTPCRWSSEILVPSYPDGGCITDPMCMHPKKCQDPEGGRVTWKLTYLPIQVLSMPIGHRFFFDSMNYMKLTNVTFP
jgi:hypothetical protein